MPKIEIEIPEIIISASLSFLLSSLLQNPAPKALVDSATGVGIYVLSKGLYKGTQAVKTALGYGADAPARVAANRM